MEEKKQKINVISDITEAPYKENTILPIIDTSIDNYYSVVTSIEDDETLKLREEAIRKFYEDLKNVGKNKQCEIGTKNDRKDNKVRMELVPLDMIVELAKVYQAGAEKYGVDNWKKFKLEDVDRMKGALLRHLVESEHKDTDDETGCYHLMQVAWNAITMLWLKQNKK